MASREQFERAMEILDQVLETAPDARPALLDELCGDQAELRREVESLLAHEETDCAPIKAASRGEGADVLAAALMSATSDEIHETLPEQIGQFRVVRAIGQGGMGIIYEAEQQDPRRRVALKVLRPGMMSASMLRRFRHEAHVLGQLQHPGIAHIYDAGLADLPQGRQPYFAMEYIEGAPLDRHADEQQLSVRHRLELLARVCDAVQHAHQKGIIHRDLKPQNVLVLQHQESSRISGGTSSSHLTAIDGIGLPKVLDFGIARVTDADVQTATMQTEVGQLIGTLAYMSPEQVAGDSRTLDTRCDVYALGVMLYELLAGERPHRLTGLSVPEAARTVREQEPARLGTHDRTLRGDIETIVAKAMEKERDRRYGSAAELAADIRRFLADEPIEARPATTLYQLQRFTRRNKGLVAGLAATFGMLVVALVGTSYGLWQAAEQRTQLQAVVDYQSEMLERVEVSEMGQKIFAHLRTDAREALAGDDEVRTSQLAAFEQVLSLLNATAIANRSLDDSIMSPAVESLDSFEDQPALRAELRTSLAEIYASIGLPEKSLAQAEQVYEERKSVLGALAPATLAARHQVCDQLNRLGRFEEAEALARELIASRKQVLGPQHLDTLASQRLLGQSLTKLTRPDEAEQLLLDTVATLQRVAGTEDENTLAARVMLANHYYQQRDMDVAHEILAEVLATLEKTLGPDHPQTLARVGEIARLKFSERRHEESAAGYRRVSNALTKTLGPDHPETLTARHGLCEALTESRAFEEAEPIVMDTLARRRRVLGPDHPQTVSSLRAATRLKVRMARWEEAEPYSREALAITLRTVGPDNSLTLDARSDLALVLHKAGQLERAEPRSQEALGEFRRVLGRDHYRTLVCQSYHGKILMTRRKLEEARQIQQDLLEIAREKYADAGILAGTLGEISAVLIGLDRAQEAVERVDELIAWCVRRNVHPTSLGKAHVWRARALCAQDKWTEADSALQRAIALYEEHGVENSVVLVARLMRSAIAVRSGDASQMDATRDYFRRFQAAAAGFKPEERATLAPEMRRIIEAAGIKIDSTDTP